MRCLLSIFSTFIYLCLDTLPAYHACTYETGMCDWVLGRHFQGFAWKLHHGPKAPSDTGPNVDHTTGTTDGMYNNYPNKWKTDIVLFMCC